MTRTLPESPRLSHLRGQARSFLTLVRTGDIAAIDRVRTAHPRFAMLADPAALRLADIQFVLALEYGFESWTRLKQFVAVRDPEVLEHAFQTVKDGWISVQDVPGDPAKLRRLLKEYPGLVHARIRTHGYTLLHYAAYRNYVEVAQILIAAGADVLARDYGGATPLAISLTYPSPEMTRLLLPYGRVPDNLRTAAALGDRDGIDRFVAPDGSLKAGAGDDREEWSRSYSFAARPLLHDPADILTEALGYAAQNGQIAAARMLVQRGAPLNRIAFIGTPLHWAALYGQRDAVDYLITAGADVNLRDDEYGANAAGWAEFFGHYALALELIDRGTTLKEDEVGTFELLRARMEPAAAADLPDS